MALFGAISRIVRRKGRAPGAREWVDACIVAHVEQGVPYDDAARRCRGMIDGDAADA